MVNQKIDLLIIALFYSYKRRYNCGSNVDRLHHIRYTKRAIAKAVNYWTKWPKVNFERFIKFRIKKIAWSSKFESNRIESNVVECAIVKHHEIHCQWRIALIIHNVTSFVSNSHLTDQFFFCVFLIPMKTLHIPYPRDQVINRKAINTNTLSLQQQNGIQKILNSLKPPNIQNAQP